MTTIRILTVLIACCLGSFALEGTGTAEDSISYARDIAPLLQKNCVACHRAKQAEGGLSMETSDTIQAGGDGGPFVVAGNPDESSLFLRICDEDDPMPPEGNTVGAKRFSKDEQELIRTWILKGAEIDRIGADDTIDWLPIPESVRSSFSIATTPDNRFVVIGRANRVSVADAQTGSVASKLADETLSQPAADVDFVQAIAVSPLGDRIATGGFKTVRIWERVPVRSHFTGAPRSGVLSLAAGIIAPSPDGSEIALVNAIGDVEIWDRDGRNRRLTIPGKGVVADLVWRAPETLVVGSESGDVRLCTSTDGVDATTVKLDHPVAQLDQSSDGQFVVVLGPSSQLRVFQGLKEKASPTLAAIGNATSVAMVGQAKIAIGTSSGEVIIADLKNGETIHKLVHGTAITSLAVNPAGATVASGGEDGSVKLWNVGDGKLAHTLSGDAKTFLKIAAVGKDLAREESWLTTLNQKTEQLKKRLESEDAALAKVTEAREKAAKEFDDKTKQRDEVVMQVSQSEAKLARGKEEIEKNAQAIVRSESMLAKFEMQIKTLETEIEPLKQKAAVASTDVNSAKAKVEEAMRLLAVAEEAARKQRALKQQKETQLAASKKGFHNTTTTLEAAKAGKSTATKKVEAENAALAKLREKLTANEKEVETKKADLAERDQALATAKVTRDRAAANLPKHDDKIRVQANRLAELKRHQERLNRTVQSMPPVSAIAFSDDASKVAICDRRGGIRLFTAPSGAPLDRFQIDSKSNFDCLTRAHFADEEDLIVSRHRGECSRITTATHWVLSKIIGGLDSELISDRVTALDFHPDGRSLALGSGTPSRSGEVLIVDASSGSLLREFGDVHSDTVLCVRFSPNGRTLASSSADKTIRLIDVDSREIVGALDGHTHHVLSVAWKRDGRLLASGGADATIKTWDVETGQRKRSIGGFGDEVTAVSFLGDTTQVVSASADGQVRIHETNNGGQVRNVGAAGDVLFTMGVGGDGGRVFAAGQTGSIHVWQVEGLKPIAKWD